MLDLLKTATAVFFNLNVGVRLCKHFFTSFKWGGFATVMRYAVRTCPGSDKMVHGKTMQGGAYGN